jgi:uncharacterized membrane protein YidH (DUF202 family)
MATFSVPGPPPLLVKSTLILINILIFCLGAAKFTQEASASTQEGPRRLREGSIISTLTFILLLIYVTK